jgi:mannose-1-phosphate guanylyltransferase/mannose-6-phosphate isomerase
MKSDAENAMIPVILSGGSGTRLWPVSRRAHPKPFMKLVDGESLAEKTFRRALGVAGANPVLTVTSRDHYFYTRDLYNLVDGEEHGHPFLLEPIGRNTAPAIALAALFVRETVGPEALMLVLPADHLVRDIARFQAAVAEARVLAARGYLVTFAIHPTHAETGYGYIRKGAPIHGSGGTAIRFVRRVRLELGHVLFRSGRLPGSPDRACACNLSMRGRMLGSDGQGRTSYGNSDGIVPAVPLRFD